MFKALQRDALFFDVEWVPDPMAGRLAYGLPSSTSDAEVVAHMYKEGGATMENPRPYLKTALCQVVAIGFLRRSIRPVNGILTPHFELRSFPGVDQRMSEGQLLTAFLSGIGAIGRPQLFGYNSKSADIWILLQRAMVHSICAPGFGRRPDKPWEGVDYFDRYGSSHVDLKETMSGWGKSTPTLREVCAACGIPSKLGHDGSQVYDMWAAGEISAITKYVQLDVLPVYQLAMRMALVAGLVSSKEFIDESVVFGQYLVDLAEIHGQSHIADYLNEGQRMRNEMTTIVPAAA